MNQPTKNTFSKAPQFMRAKEASAYFQIAESTLWYWVKSRPGFPPPIKAGERVTLFDVPAVEVFLRGEG